MKYFILPTSVWPEHADKCSPRSQVILKTESHPLNAFNTHTTGKRRFKFSSSVSGELLNFLMGHAELSALMLLML